MKRRFEEWNPNPLSVAMIQAANGIIEEYQAHGLRVTLRQLFYQFVARDLIANTNKAYKNLGRAIDKGRMAGLVDWDAIEDRTRTPTHAPAWASPVEIVQACAQQFKVDPWQNQEFYVEVWVEKEALISVVEQACEPLRVTFLACRGYMSQSAVYAASRRFVEALRKKKKAVLFHLGDHDPSGMDMTRDNDDRLGLMAHSGVTVRRLALNMDQVEELGPPPNAAKESDSRFRHYSAVYGDESWELDAIEPRAMQALIRTPIEALIDKPAWDLEMAREKEGRAAIARKAEELKATP